MAKYPAQRRFMVELAPNTTSYVDVPAMLSRINQRLYRQGMGYTISSIELGIQGSGSRAATIGTLPQTWFLTNAHKTAQKVAEMATADEVAHGIKAGRYNDFRVYFDDTHAAAGSVNSPVGLAPMTEGEYNYTQVGLADGSGTRKIWMIGGTNPANGFNATREYDRSRNATVDTDSAQTTEVPFAGLLAELDDTQAEQLQEQGDLPPYEAYTEYNNLVSPTWTVFNGIMGPYDAGAQPGAVRLDDLHTQRNIYAPCGLLKISTLQDPVDGQNPSPVYLTIEVKAGKYKGVDAHDM